MKTRRFGKVSDSIYKDFKKAERIVAFNMPLMQVAVYTCMLLISWIGARLIIGSHGMAGGMTTGQLMSMFSYTMQILMSLMMLSNVFVMITISRASAERIVEILEEESDIKNPASPVMEVADGSVVFDHVDFSYAGDQEQAVPVRDQSFHSVRRDGGDHRRNRFVQELPGAAHSKTV